MITIENKKLHDLIVMKDDLVTEGRKITNQMEKNSEKIKQYENKEKKITGSVKPDEKLKAEGDALVEVFNATLKKLEEIGQSIEKEKMKAIPQEMIDEHNALLKENERLERERNKIALKVQKVKDKVIPIVQKAVKPMLNEYDDIETAIAKNGKVNITTFNYLEDFKSKFKK